MKNLKRIFCLGLALSTITILQSDMIDMRSESKFDRMLNKRSLVVAMFYKSDRDTRKNEDLRMNIAELERMFKRVSEEERYKDAKVMFVRVNVVGSSAEELANRYGVSTLPTFMLFKDGRVIRSGENKRAIAAKQGFIRGHALSLFIDEYLGETINTYVQVNAERKRRRARTHRTYTYVGYGYGAYPYYGSYGYPYYGYGGGVGFGIGF